MPQSPVSPGHSHTAFENDSNAGPIIKCSRYGENVSIGHIGMKPQIVLSKLDLMKPD
jgi:hypothetical protein